MAIAKGSEPDVALLVDVRRARGVALEIDQCFGGRGLFGCSFGGSYQPFFSEPVCEGTSGIAADPGTMPPHAHRGRRLRPCARSLRHAWSLHLRHPAVDEELDSRNKTAVVRSEEDGGFRDVGGLPDTAERNDRRQ